MQVVVLAMMMISLISCGAPAAFEVHARYRSVADPARRYEIHTFGTVPTGADMAENYRASIRISIGDERHEIRVRAEQFTPLVEQVQSAKDFPDVSAQPIDVAFLIDFMETLDPAVPQEWIALEAKELFASMEAAGMGPKIGLPETRALLLKSVSVDYR